MSSVKLFDEDDIGQNSCLYDALTVLGSLVFKHYMSVEEKISERVTINQIEVIGIGNCVDNCSSELSKDFGTEAFYRVAKNPNVMTKYLCLSEETFMNAAKIGFHSIGSISRKY